ncbi:hypothetical protein PRUB_a3303 [Pseudoalteromonas rubra]|uniref:Uncharacterized protein n=1 Tax=Pseudoalteromonas rubra TaxID=43658 RepID=A0A8T0C2R2_9GAMM|nr:hypothetical protein [Pseudoalteromonas rubra]KAF7783515.1 hypothetical protein PRUB_a3303 [Pseudoalteromonas rubra]
MNELDLQSFNIKIIGPGREYFQPISSEEADNFSEKGLYLSITEGFSAPEVTQVLISIGSNVVAGLSVYYISKLFDKIFSAKAKAKKEGREIQISVSIQEKIHIKNVESSIEIEKALDIVVTKTKQE